MALVMSALNSKTCSDPPLQLGPACGILSGPVCTEFADPFAVLNSYVFAALMLAALISFSTRNEARDLQSRFEIAKCYRQHVEQVGADRSVEDWMQALLWVSHILKFSSVFNRDCLENME